MTEEEAKRHYVLIKNFNTCMYDHTIHRGRKHFCHHCLQAFSSEEILKCHIKEKCYLKIALKLIVNKH